MKRSSFTRLFSHPLLQLGKNRFVIFRGHGRRVKGVHNLTSLFSVSLLELKNEVTTEKRTTLHHLCPNLEKISGLLFSYFLFHDFVLPQQ